MVEVEAVLGAGLGGHNGEPARVADGVAPGEADRGGGRLEEARSKVEVRSWIAGPVG